jgi:hypothetical protein
MTAKTAMTLGEAKGTSRNGQAEPVNRAGRTGQSEQYRQKRTGKIGQANRKRQNEIDGTGQSE